MKKKTDAKPIIFVLFGATGDLALKKIFPALEDLYSSSAIAPQSKIIAVSRREWGTPELVSFIQATHGEYNAAFIETLSYAKIDIESGEGYSALNASVGGYAAVMPYAEIIVYLSLAPSNHEKALIDLDKSGLLKRKGVKLLIEKPFGTDEKTADSLNLLLSRFLPEKQIFRVDHYLGKDTVRAVMDLHERTKEFSRLVSKENVASIKIRLFETKGIDGRGASYDGVGSFRDVGQNHMLEMLAVVSAEPKRRIFGGLSWQASRAKVLSLLEPPAKTCDLSRRGQYVGYHAEKGVKLGSETETAFEITTTFTGGKLSGVPLILESGKKMPTSEVFIEIAFKDRPDVPKTITFSVQPDQKMTIVGRNGRIESFDVPKTRDAYANVIAAALAGQSKDFVGKEEIRALWNYADHIVACWGKVPLEIYSAEKPFLLK